MAREYYKSDYTVVNAVRELLGLPPIEHTEPRRSEGLHAHEYVGFDGGSEVEFLAMPAAQRLHFTRQHVRAYER